MGGGKCGRLRVGILPVCRPARPMAVWSFHIFPHLRHFVMRTAPPSPPPRHVLALILTASSNTCWTWGGAEAEGAEGAAA